MKRNPRNPESTHSWQVILEFLGFLGEFEDAYGLCVSGDDVMEKGDRAFPAPAEPDRRRHGDTSRLLVAYWLRFGELLLFVRFPRRRALSGVFLPWHTGAHPALHVDILHDLHH